MYMIIIHGHNTIHWARSYCGLANILRDANKYRDWEKIGRAHV